MRAQVLVGDLAAPLEVGAERLELGLQVPAADAQDDASAATGGRACRTAWRRPADGGTAAPARASSSRMRDVTPATKASVLPASYQVGAHRLGARHRHRRDGRCTTPSRSRRPRPRVRPRGSSRRRPRAPTGGRATGSAGSPGRPVPKRTRASRRASTRPRRVKPNDPAGRPAGQARPCVGRSRSACWICSDRRSHAGAAGAG